MPNLHELNTSQLSELTQNYPYFSAAQILLAKKLKEENNQAAYLEQSQKCLLYVSNHIWLNYLLRDESEDNEFVLKDDNNDKLSQMLARQAAEAAKDVDEKSQLIQEAVPLYRVDYFKHQGIDVAKDESPQESAFGTKVKKFTDWLKDMKKLNPTAEQLNTSAAEEAAAARSAAHSLEDKGVITESMAEVLALQGKTEQAIDLYQKLSLSNPEKSAYFAAKIKNLKENNL